MNKLLSRWVGLQSFIKFGLKAVVVFAFFSSASFADIQKYVFIYDTAGTLLSPSNAADNCPDPDVDSLTSANPCKGVLVNEDGEYSLKFSKKSFPSNGKVVLIANTYNLDDSNYILLDSKRRADKIKSDKKNRGIDINSISEFAVTAVEKVKGVSKGKKSKANKELLEAIEEVDVEKVNKALNNDQASNESTTENEKKEKDRKELKKEELDDYEEELVALAQLAVENQDDDRILDYIQKNFDQIVTQPALVAEIGQRVFSHVVDIKQGSADRSLIILEADKYVVYPDQNIALTTSNSINASKFFGYTWDGVDSILSSATFTKDSTGGYLVCVTGEADATEDTGTDCVRLAVKNEIEAIARVSHKRVGTGNSVKVSASLSVGATSYAWSGDGSFSDATAEFTQWVAPEVPGIYQLQLSINGGADTVTVDVNVFDVVPVAIAEASPNIIYIENNSATSSLVSGSISTDGSAIETLTWSVLSSPANSNPQISDSAAKITTFTADALGEYTVKLAALKRAVTDSTELTIHVRQRGAPVANAGSDITTFRSQEVTLNGSNSYSSDNNILTYLWQAVSGLLSDATNVNAKFSTDTVGDYDVSLAVSDGNLSSDDNVKVTVVNRKPVASDDHVKQSLDEIFHGLAVASDGDKDTLTYEVISQPVSGGVTLDPVSGVYTYVPGGVKGCQYQPFAKPYDNGNGGLDVPVIKLCADKYVVAVGETVNLTASNSINASKFSGYEWLNGAVGDGNDIRLATYVATEAGFHQICVRGNIGQSNNTSTACVDIEVDGTLTVGDNECRVDYEDPGLVGGHFDVDTTNSISAINSGSTAKHTHEYDDKFDVVGVDALAMRDGHVKLSDAVGANQRFKLIIANADLSPGARISINRDYDHTSSSSYVAATSYDDTAPSSLPVYSLSGVAGTTGLDNLSVNFDRRAIVYKDLHPTNTGDVRKNVAGKLGEWRNGAFVIQAIAVDENGQDLFTTDTSKSNGGTQGVASTGLLWELTVFWHWDGPSYHQSGWSTYEPKVEGSTTSTPSNSGTTGCGSINDGYQDSFDFRVTDGLDNSNIATIWFNVDWTDAVPIVEGFALSTPEETAVNGTFTATDVDLHKVTYRISANGTLGTAVVTNAATGTFTYTPAKDQFGVDTFSYVANDGYQDSIAGTVTVTVVNQNDYPVAYALAPVTTDEDVATSGQLSALDPDGDVLEYRLATIPNQGTVVITDSATGAYLYTPNKDKNGQDSFYFVAFDGQVESNVAKIDINITPVNDQPIADDQGPLNVNADQTLSGSLTASDVDLDALVYRVGGQGQKGTVIIDAVTGDFVYTPRIDQLGSDQFTFYVEDGLTQSASATVTLNILAPNIAPVAVTQSITVFEDVVYGGILVGSDSEGATLTFAVANQGKLGEVEVTNANSGAYSYKPKSGASGSDYFTFTVSDGEKTSSPVIVSVNIIPNGVSCVGPGNNKQDNDQDGYANYIELAFGTNINDANSKPVGTLVDNSISFTDDDDSDQFSDVSELWLKTDHSSSVSIPTQSTLLGLPKCLSTLYDSVAPALHGFAITTPSLDISTTLVGAGFAISVLDNASGVSKIELQLVSPSGAVVKGSLTDSSNPIALITEFTSEKFTKYAEAGVWKVDELIITDAIGNSVTLSTADLITLEYPVDVTIINSNSDIVAPVLTNLVIQTPTLDISSGTAVATFDVSATDNLAGVKRINLTLQSPSGATFRTVESVLTTPLTTVTALSINSEVFNTTDENGTWFISSAVLTDDAGNTASYDTTALQTASFTTDIIVTDGVPDTTAPQLATFNTLTSRIYPSQGDAQASFQFGVTDDSGVSSIELILQGPTGGFLTVSYSSLDDPTNLDATVYSPVFPVYAAPGPCVYYRLNITDLAGNVSTWSTAELAALGFTTSFEVIQPPTLPGIPNNAPFAYTGNLYATEDTATTGTLLAVDVDGDALTYAIITQPSNGVVAITNIATGAYSYTPNADFNGSDVFSFQVDDGSLESNIAIINVGVTATDDETTAAGFTLRVVENLAKAVNLVGADPDGLALTFTIIDQPSLGIINFTDATKGYALYTPNTDVTGVDSFTYRVNDANSQSAVVTVSITIVPEMDLTGFDVVSKIVSGLNALAPVKADVTLSKEITAIDSVFVSLIGPSGQEYVVRAFVRSGDEYPIHFDNDVDTSLFPLEVGTWTFSNLRVKKTTSSVYELLVSDIGARGFDDTLEVIANTSPVADRNEVYSVAINRAKTGTLIATDPENDSLTYSILSNGNFGSVVITDAATGAFTYTPTALGNDSFTFIANDGYEDSNIGLVQITVTEVNGIPFAQDTSVVVTKNFAFVGQLGAVDADNDPMTYRASSQPTQGSVAVDSSTGVFTYYPDTDKLGADSFEFIANDGVTDSNAAKVTINIVAGNAKPIAANSTIYVFENITYNGNLSATDPEGATLTYSLINGAGKGSITVDASTGAYTFVPTANVIGVDSFQYVASDGQVNSNITTVSVNILNRDQACGTGGLVTGLDSDGDGYIDYVEVALGTDPNLANSTPQNVSATDFSNLFNDDDDSDTYQDYIELWLGSNPADDQSIPKIYLSECFQSTSDGIKPRLVGLNIETTTVDIGAGDTSANIAVSMLDNASGIKRIRLSLRSPSGAFMTVAKSYSDLPVLLADQLSLSDFNQFSEQGTWDISSITLYDDAGNRLDISNADLVAESLPNTISVVNTNSDSTAPTLSDFQITSGIVYPGTANDRMKVTLTADDAGAGVVSVRVDFISATSKLVTVSQTLATNTASATIQLESPTMSQYAEDGIWTVFSVLLVDGAGNSAQLAGQLTTLGFANTVQVTNPLSDIVAPSLESLSVLSSSVYPAAGDAKMRFSITAADNAAGIRKIQITVEGPSGQVIPVSGEFTAQQPINTTVQIESALLSTMTEQGIWTISYIEVFDDAGNKTSYDTVDLSNAGYFTQIQVIYP